MALESVSVADNVIQSNDENDLEDGEIPSDEDDEPIPVTQPEKRSPEPPKPVLQKSESPKHKSSENKIGKDKITESGGKSSKQKSSDDWAGDVEKAIRAALEEDKSKAHENKSRSKRSGSSSSNKKQRKRHREEKEDQRPKDQKKKRLSEEENVINEDDDEMLFVRGASPLRRLSFDSPHRRSDHDSYNSGSDFDDRPISNRHRDDKRSGGRWAQSRQMSPDRGKKAPISTSRRITKVDRNIKNKMGGRMQLRNDRNDRRRNMNDHIQDPDAICVYYMQGKCHRGDDCPYSHDALPPRKMELCKFYLMDCCAKRDKCLYMHHDFPCKFFHTGSKCTTGEICKFSHEPMNEQVKNILLKHLETAPKEILGNFPRLSREGALYLINTTEKKLSEGQDSSNQKIPSLFDLEVPTPNDNTSSDHRKDDGDDYNRDRNSSMYKDKKSSSGKRTRWGADEDRIPIDMLVKSANLGTLANNQDKPQVAANFYGETGSNDLIKEIREEPKNDSLSITLSGLSKDVDLRQLLLAAKSSSQTLSLAEQAANYAKLKLEEGRDHDEEGGIVIEMQTDEESRNKIKSLETKISQQNSELDKLRNSPNLGTQEIPSNLPKRTQELYTRIQQQQREATDSHKNLENTENQQVNQEDWYSDDDNVDDDDDDDENQLTIVDSQKEEEEEDKSKDEPLQPASIPDCIPQPAAIVDKLGDLSKIDISMEVSKLLSSIKAQSSSSKHKQEKDTVPKLKKEMSPPGDNADAKPNVPEISSQLSKLETGDNSPRMSPSSTNASAAASSNVSRDPRMSRDPRQRRDENRQSIGSASAVKQSEPKDSRSMRLETSIYSSGIIAQDTGLDTDLRSDRDQDHRRKDMDLRCFPPTSNFGDTDLRFGSAHYPADTSKSGDIDLRHMLSLPFKPVPSHVPCTEIEAGINSHPLMTFKVYVVDVPRPDYTGLKLTRNDPQVKYDPRLRKILRLSKDDLADSPMSPPPVKMLDTPKSPPLVRVDPRRKAHEISAHPPKIIPTAVQQHPVHEHPNLPGMAMNINANYSQGPVNMQQVPIMHQQNMGAPNMMMQTNSVMNTPLLRDPVIGQAPVLSNSAGSGGLMISSNMRMNNMGPQGPAHSASQMNQYDPRYNAQRGAGVGLLGIAPQNMAPYNSDVRAYDGPPSRYPHDNYNNYGNNQNMDRDPRGYNNGQMDDSNYMGSPSDWNGSQGRMRDRKDRRRQTRGKFGGLSRKKDL